MKEFIRTLTTPKEMWDVIIKALGGDPEWDKNMNTNVTKYVPVCKDYPNCDRRSCVHALPCPLCPQGEACVKSHCLKYHPVQALNHFFQLNGDEF
ncbi:unnamed protein product [Rodentolepis nana]|uniref:C3H1-type domain-containing protein n=1 Tax=Rodentolepis nana TaxID=102285 RepID=A0A0R3TZL7_RODNA|nr:unnamed protein product [Rodentolepis nana]